MADNQRRFGKAFKKLASERSKAEKTYASKTTKRHATASASLRSCFSTLFCKLTHFINSAASTSLKCLTVFTLSSMRNSVQKSSLSK